MKQDFLWWFLFFLGAALLFTTGVSVRKTTGCETQLEAVTAQFEATRKAQKKQIEQLYADKDLMAACIRDFADI